MEQNVLVLVFVYQLIFSSEIRTVYLESGSQSFSTNDQHAGLPVGPPSLPQIRNNPDCYYDYISFEILFQPGFVKIIILVDATCQ